MDKIREIPVKDWVILAGAALSACAISATDSGSREIPNYSALRGPGEVYSVMAKVNENDANDYADKQTRKDIDKARNAFLKANGYSENRCTKCSTIMTDDASIIEEVAEGWKVPKNEAFAISYKESRIRQLDNNRPIMSEDKAFGLYQLREIGFEEIWNVFNNPQPHQRGFIKANKESIEKYSHLMKGDFDLIWNNYISYDSKTNAIAGIGLYKLYKFKENGNKREARRDFFAGPTDKHKFVNSSNNYAKSVHEHEDYFTKKCPSIVNGINNLKMLEDSLYKTHKRTYIASRSRR